VDNPGMGAGDIHHKTALGLAEIRDRKLKLSPRLRTMLILIDGVRPEFILREEAAKVGAPPDFLAQLESAGLIERTKGDAGTPGAPAPPVPGDEFTRFREAKNFMNTTVVDALGIRSFLFTMKLERAGVVADLVELVEPYREAIAKGAGKEQADVMVARLQEMLR
jgi:hypothetical protein